MGLGGFEMSGDMKNTLTGASAGIVLSNRAKCADFLASSQDPNPKPPEHAQRNWMRPQDDAHQKPQTV